MRIRETKRLKNSARMRKKMSKNLPESFDFELELDDFCKDFSLSSFGI